MIRTTTEKVHRAIKHLIQKKIPFRMLQTNQRLEVYSPIANYTNRDSEFPAHELNFIRRVKESIIENGLQHTVPNKFQSKKDLERIRYFFYNPNYREGTHIEDCWEIDLKSAYWEMAHKLNLLSDEMYAKGKTISKASRLASIGTLNKKVKIFKFDGQKQRLVKTKRSRETEHLWHTICFNIGKMMMESVKLCKKNDFIFFWVDAMFVRKEALPALEKFFKKQGYDYTVHHCESVKFTADNIIVDEKEKWVKEENKWARSGSRLFPYNERLNKLKRPR